MSVAYAYENGWDIGAGARGGHMMVASQSHVCGGDAPTFRSKHQQDSMIRGFSAISKYMHSQPAQPDCCSKPSPPSPGPSSPPCLSSLSEDRMSPPSSSPPPHLSGASSRIEPANAEAHPQSSPGSGATSSEMASDVTDQPFLGLSQHVDDHAASEALFIDTHVEGDEPQQPGDGALVPQRFPTPASSASSLSSSIGEARDDSSSSSEDDKDMEAQSAYRGPLEQMSELESSLPIKRGLSRYFNGKSRSFTSLADASSLLDVKELAKAENPFNRKRKMFGGGHHRCFPPLPSGAGVSKRTTATNRSNLALSVSIISEVDHAPPRGRQSSSVPPRSPAPSRSFSLTDLPGTSGLSSSFRGA